MSSYRDDTQETVVASSSTWVGLQSVTEEFAKIADLAIVGLLVLTVESAAASDEVIDRVRTAVVDTVTVSDEVIDHIDARNFVVETASAFDTVTPKLLVVTDESVFIGDDVVDSVLSVTTEAAAIHDELLSQKIARILIEESAKASESTIQAAHVLIIESVGASDFTTGLARSKAFIDEQVIVVDEEFGSRQAHGAAMYEVAAISDEVFDRLIAHNLIADSVQIDDAEFSSYPSTGQAWTANVDSWAMSRYAPYTFDQIAVIDGIAYGTNENGVFALSGGSEVITGSLQTGKIDIGSGSLVHPLHAYLEYELNGTASMDVSTTQSGSLLSYTYTLPAELANELTNGRFVFGRGLRGRHFGFNLRLTGSHGHINDLSVSYAQTSRRI